MADVGASASDAVKKIRDLRLGKKKIDEKLDQVMSLVSTLRKTRRLFHRSNLDEEDEHAFRHYAHAMEDVLESFVLDTADTFQKNEGRFIKRFFRKKISVVLENFKTDFSRFHLRIFTFVVDCVIDNQITNIHNKPFVASRDLGCLRQTYPRGVEEYFVGMDDELKKLLSLIVKKQTRVISIWGVTGSGKTTITVKIYKQLIKMKSFQAFAWVCHSQVSEIRIILLHILRQLCPREQIDEKSDLETLKKLLKEVERDCLIVLDDVQVMDGWRELRPALEMEGVRSVILLTTREENIATEAGSPHKLRLLNEDEGWDLLKKHAFPRKDGPDCGLISRLGKEMVRKCGYLPSAISELGRVLSSKISLDHWQMVNDDVSKYIQGQQIKRDEELNTSLDSNYYKLPYYLKQCFLYLGIFRKDEEIDVEDLYFLWIAEGMTVDLANEEVMALDSAKEDRQEMTLGIANADREETVQEIANDYKAETTLNIRNEEETTPEITNIDGEDITTQNTANDDRKESTLDRAAKCLTELVSREMVRVLRDELSATRSQPCFLHSTSRELDSWEKEKEHISLEIIDVCNKKQSTLGCIPDTARRLAVRFNQEEKLENDDWQSDQLRSLFLLNSGKKSVELPLTTANFGKFKLLRVLNFVRCKFEGRKLPKWIDGLLNLRYLGLLYCDLDDLTSSIGNLRNLRILNVRVLENYHLVIPNVLHQLVLLNHLRLPYCTDREQNQKLILGALPELETLLGFNGLMHDLPALSKLHKLRYLGAHVYSNASLNSLLEFIRSRGNRIQINLFIENLCDLTSEKGVNILEEVLMCPNLDALTLSNVLIYKIPDCRPYLSSHLTQLKLIGCRIKEDPMEVLGNFPNLQKLCLGYGAFVGKEMTARANGFPKLEYLEMRSLPYFEEWSVDEGAMRNLSTLIIQGCPRLKKIPNAFSNVKNLEIKLSPEAAEDVTTEKYREKFKFDPSPITRAHAIERQASTSTRENSFQ